MLRPQGDAPKPVTTPASFERDAPEADAPTPGPSPSPSPPLAARPQPTPLLDAAIARVESHVAPEPPSIPTPAEAPAAPTTEAEAVPVPPAAGPAPAESSEPPPAESAVSAPSTPIPTLAPATTPADDWSAGLVRLRRVARQRADESPDDFDEWQTRARVLERMADDRPVGPAWSTMVVALDAVQSPGEADPGAVAPRVRAAVDALESLAPFTVGPPRLCRKINGFGDFDPVEPATLRAGRPTLVYCELSGQRAEPGVTDEAFHSRLASRVEVGPAGGGEPIWSREMDPPEDVCRSRRRDFYVNYRLDLPATLTPGAYTLKLTLSDRVSGRSASASAPFDLTP